MAQRGRPPDAPLDWGDDELATRVNRDFACLSLVAREGPVAGRVYGSDGDPLTIGRGAGCAVRLPLSEISRRHARIRYQAGRFWVEDLQTLNGTWLNGQLLERLTPLKAGDRLRIGAQELEVRYELLVNRQVVHDSAELYADEGGRAPAPAPVVQWVKLGALTLLMVLIAAALTVIVIRVATRSNLPVVVTAPAPALTPRPAATGVAASGVAVAPSPPAGPARLEPQELVIVTASENGVVQRALPRGSTVRAGEEVLRYRGRDNSRQRELEELNARLEDNEDNAELAQRARELAEEVAEGPRPVALKSALDGVVVGVAAVGARLHAGDEAFRVARSLRLVDARIEGDGAACTVQLPDQNLELEARRVAGIVEVVRFPAQLSLERLGAVRVRCR